MNWDFTNDSHIGRQTPSLFKGYRFSTAGHGRDQHIYFRARFSKPFENELDTTAIIKIINASALR